MWYLGTHSKSLFFSQFLYRAELVSGSALQHLPGHTALPYTFLKEDQLSWHCFSSWELSSVQRNPHSTQANIQLNERGWGSGSSKWLDITKCISVLYPRLRSSFPMSVTPPLTSGLSFDTSPTLYRQQCGGPSRSGTCIFCKVSQTAIALYK